MAWIDPIARLFAKRDAEAEKSRPVRDVMWVDGKLVHPDEETVTIRGKEGKLTQCRAESLHQYLQGVANARAR